MLSHIEGAQIINECEDIGFAFGLFETLKGSKNVNEVIEFIKRRSIIVKNDEKIINEFLRSMRIADELAGDTVARHLTRRHLSYRGERDASLKILNDYWRETTADGLAFKDVSFAGENVYVKLERIVDVHFPTKTFHERGLLDREEFHKESRYEVVETIMNKKIQIFKGLLLLR